MDNAENFLEQLDILIRKIAEYEAMPAENIFCAASPDDIIFRAVLAQKPEKAVVSDTLTEAVRALELMDCEIIKVSDIKGTPCDDDDIDMVILTRTDIPTAVSSYKARLVIVEQDVYISEERDDLPENAAVIKRYPKFGQPHFGVCLCRDRGFIERLGQCGPLRSIAPSVLAALSGFDPAEEKRREKYLIRERDYLSECFERLGIKVYPSSGKYIITESVLPIGEMLMRHDIRTLRSLGNGRYVVPVSNHENNAGLIYALTAETGRLLPLNFAAKPYCR